MGYLDAIILGLVQGLTEFLPVSSSGHLVILQCFMGYEEAMENVTFDVFLHVATVLAVLWIYRANVKEIFTGGSVGEGDNPIPTGRLLLFLIISIVVTGIVFPFRHRMDVLFENISGVRILLIINAIALAVLPRFRRGDKGLGQMTWIGAVVIGLAQAAGAFPGISRSGSTILAGLLLGLAPKEACRYSFLLSIPTILIVAATLIPEAFAAGVAFSPGTIIAGSIFALASGLLAIPFLVGVVEKGKLWGFAIYCAVVGIALFFADFIQGCFA